MYYFILLDDNSLHNNYMNIKLIHLIQKLNLDAEVALATTDPKQVTEYSMVNKYRNNIYFLDVDIHSNITGIDVAGMIRSQEAGAYIVFVSAHPEFVMPSLKTRIFDYLIKPVTMEMVETCIKAILCDYKMLNKPTEIKTINIKSKSQVFSIAVNEIIYIEKFKHVLVVHTLTGRIEGSETLESIITMLNQDNFYRCHKSYIVNLAYISRIDYSSHTIYLKNGEACQFSKRMKKELKQLCYYL